MKMQGERLYILKVNRHNHPQMHRLFVINSSKRLQQSYSGIYDISTIIDIIRGYRPSQIIINCADFHAKEIVKFIFHIQMMKKYRLLIGRYIFRDQNIRIRIIVLKFNFIV